MSLDISKRLRQGPVLILDGAIGTELQRNDVPMDTSVWAALAAMSHPDVLRRIHSRYIASGANIVTTNTFAAARHVLESIGMGENTARINIETVAIARQAIEETADSEVILAGSMSSMGPLSKGLAPQNGQLEASYREQAYLLAEGGVDLIIAEMMVDTWCASLIAGAAKEAGLPLLMGWSVEHVDEHGSAFTYSTGDGRQYRLRDLYSAEQLLDSACAGIMHSSVQVTTLALHALKEFWHGPRMAYAEVGTWEPPNWVFAPMSPATYATHAARWVEAGATIVGGCCGTTPEHIAAVHDLLAQGSPRVQG